MKSSKFCGIEGGAGRVLRNSPNGLELKKQLFANEHMPFVLFNGKHFAPVRWCPSPTLKRTGGEKKTKETLGSPL